MYGSLQVGENVQCESPWPCGNCWITLLGQSTLLSETCFGRVLFHTESYLWYNYLYNLIQSGLFVISRYVLNIYNIQWYCFKGCKENSVPLRKGSHDFPCQRSLWWTYGQGTKINISDDRSWVQGDYGQATSLVTTITPSKRGEWTKTWMKE